MQFKDQKYDPVLTATDKPAIQLNKRTDGSHAAGAARNITTTRRNTRRYLDQLGVKYPNLDTSGK